MAIFVSTGREFSLEYFLTLNHICMKLRNGIYCVMGCLLMCLSCSKDVYVEPDPEPKPNPDDDNPKVEKVITVDDLKIKSISISPDDNPAVYGTVTFKQDDSGIYKGKIDHYKTDITSLKATFDVVAARVSVNGVDQDSGNTANDFSKQIVYRLYADDGQYKDYSVELETGTYTGLPLVAILTDGGKPISSRDVWVSGRALVDSQDSDFEGFSGNAEFKGRGNNTWSMDKKPYAIKLSEKSPLLGMNKHKRWVLLANASDRTLLRNRVAFEIGRRTGLAWTSDSRFVEVMLNGKYLGSYLLCEQIRVDKNRVNITEMEKNDTQGEALTGGYMLECDRYYDEINKFRSAYRDLPINVKEPDEDVLGEKQKQYIMDYVNHVEELLYAKEDINPDYRNYIDIDSFIDWWIVVELTHNRDTRLPGSCYMYKDRGGKLCAGPLWDFDLTTFLDSNKFLLYDYEVSDLSDPKGERSLWFKRLFQDPVFKARAKERWQSYKAGFDGIATFIDEEAAILRPSADVNWSIWKISKGSNGDGDLAWADAVARMRENYLKRLQWMDNTINAW